MTQLLPQRRLSVILGVLLSLAFLAVSLVSYYASKSTIHLALVEKELPLTSNAIYAELQKELVRPFFIASMMASNTFLQDWVAAGEKNPVLIGRYLKETQDTYQVFTSFFVSERTRQYYYHDGILKTVSPTNPADEWFFRVRTLNEPYEINIDYDLAHANALSIFINFRVFNQKHEFLGVTGVGLSMERLSQLLNYYEQQYQKRIYLVDAAGNIRLTGNSQNYPSRSIHELPGLKTIAGHMLQQKAGVYAYRVAHKNYLVHVRYMPEVRLFMCVESQEDQAIGKVQQALYFNIMMCVLIVLATIILTNMTVKLYQRKLTLMATTDNLTQLMNRQTFELLSADVLADSRKYHHSLIVLVADLDNFKQVNDTYGHAAGDKVLQDVGRLLREATRTSDMVCRWGGEEFALLLPQCSMAEGERLAEQICQKVAEHQFEYELYHIRATISIGLTSYRWDETLDETMARADSALYVVKNTGRNGAMSR